MNLERTVIASLLSGGWNHGGHILRESDFTDIRLRRIFRTIREITAKGGEVDLLVVGEKLGDPLQDFVSEFASARNCGTYAEELRDRSLCREIRNAAREIMAGQGSGKEQLIAAQSLIASLHAGAEGEVKPAGELVTEWWQELGERADSDKWLKTGFADVDSRLGGLRGGDLVTLAGRPAMGKTALALNIAQGCKAKVAVFSLEMQAPQLLDRLAANIAGVALGKVRNPKTMTEEEWSKVTDASMKIGNLPILVDDTPALTIEEIHARSRGVKSQRGLDLVMVDYLQMIEADHRMSREQQVSTISRHAKRMAKDLNIPVILLAQLSRKCEERGDKRPLMSDLRDSGAIEQDADAIGFIYRDEVYNPQTEHKGYAELIWRKVRQGEPGTNWFIFHGAYQRFLPAVEPPPQRRAISRGPYKETQPHWAD